MKLFKKIPLFVWKSILIILVYNFFVYLTARVIVSDGKLYSLAMPIDNKIPFIPVMVVIYLVCYAQWAIGYVLSCGNDKKTAWKFCVGEMAGKTVCFLFFVFLPCTMVRAEITSTGIFSRIVALVYRVDQPTNLFPSIHCFASWISYLGVRNNPNVSNRIKHFYGLFSVLVFISTLTIKQHVFLDVVGGVVLAELSYAFGNSKLVEKWMKE